MKKANLTARQQAVLDFVKGFIEKQGYPPTRAEICEGFQWSSHNAAEQHLRVIEQKGWIRMPIGISRGIVVLP